MKKILSASLLIFLSLAVFAQKESEYELQKQAETIGKGLVEAIKNNHYASIEKHLLTEPVVQRILSLKSEAVSQDSVKKTNVFIRTNFRNKLIETINTYKKAEADKDLVFQKVRIADVGKKNELFYNLFVNFTSKAGKKEEIKLRVAKEDDKFYVVSFDK